MSITKATKDQNPWDKTMDAYDELDTDLCGVRDGHSDELERLSGMFLHLFTWALGQGFRPPWLNEEQIEQYKKLYAASFDD